MRSVTLPYNLNSTRQMTKIVKFTVVAYMNVVFC